MYEISGVPIYSVGNSRPTSFPLDPAFHSICEHWLGNLGDFRKVWTSGVHGSGRAIDLHYMDSATTSRAFNADYRTWRNWTGSALANVRRRYWAIASSLHRCFTDVLTYPYGTEYWDHIHVDDGVSHIGQVLHVQAVCSYIWGRPTIIDGVWGPQTLANSDYALSQMGITGSLAEHWDAFNYHSFRRGIGIT